MHVFSRGSNGNLHLGPFVDATDGYTRETGLTIAYTQVLCAAQAGGFSAFFSEPGNLSHHGNGYYGLYIDYNELPGCGVYDVVVDIAGARPYSDKIFVIPADLYSYLFLSNSLDFSELVSFSGGISGNITGNVSGSVGSVAGNISGNLLGNVSGSVGSLATQAKTDVNAEVDAALNTAIPGSPTTGSVNAILAAIAAQASIRPTKNTGLDNFMFPMFDATTKTPKAGLTVTAERAIDGNPFSPCSNAAVELSNGVYRVSLSAGDLNGDKIMFRFSATGADDQLVEIITQG